MYRVYLSRAASCVSLYGYATITHKHIPALTSLYTLSIQVSRMIEMVATTTLCNTTNNINSGKGALTTQKLHRKAVVLSVLQLLEPKVLTHTLMHSSLP
jgi:hypothetical protein